MTTKETQTETKRNESEKQIRSAMYILATLFLLVGGLGMILDNFVGWMLEKIGISMTFFDYLLVMAMSIFLIIVGVILWVYAPEG